MRQRLLEPELAAFASAHTQGRTDGVQLGDSHVRTPSPESSAEGQPALATRFARGLAHLTNQFQQGPTLVDTEDCGENFASQLAQSSAAAAALSGDLDALPAADSGDPSATGPGASDEPMASSAEVSTASAIVAATGALAGMSATIESCLLVLTVIALGGVLFILGDVLVPLILAVFIASMLIPFIDLLTDRPLRLCGKYWCQSYWCEPALGLEERWPNWFCRTITSILTIRFPNVLAMMTTIAILGIALCGAGAVLFSSLQSFVHRAQAYEDELQHWADLGAQTVTQNVNMTVQKFLTQTSGSVDGLGVDMTDASSMYEYLTQGGIKSTFIQMIEMIGGTVASAALVVMYVIFILLGRQARGERKGKAVTYAVEHQLKIYISWKFSISGVTGLLVGSTLGYMRCDLAAMFGFLTFCLNFIPTVGLLVAVLLPLPVVVLAPVCDTDIVADLISASPHWTGSTDFVDMTVAGECYPILPNPSHAATLEAFQRQSQTICNGDHCFCCGHEPLNVATGTCCGTGRHRYPFGMTLYEKIGSFLIPYLIQVVVANFIEPIVFGKRLNLHPVAVLFALVFWYMMWGVAGAFLSVPIMSVLKILALNMDNPTAQWFARLLEGQTEKATRDSDAEYPKNFDYGSVRPSDNARASVTSNYDFDAEVALGAADAGPGYQMSARIEPRLEIRSAVRMRSSDLDGGSGSPSPVRSPAHTPPRANTAHVQSPAASDGFTLGDGDHPQLNPARRSQSGSSMSSV